MSIGAEIQLIKEEWGSKLLILGHHYQRASVLRYADETGDSLELARRAAENSQAEKIVFCGVNFMAETADILSKPNQTVFMPDTSAGCPMANMATKDQMSQAHDVLTSYGDEWLPIVYVNSTAEIKACCGNLGGSACTSSNAKRVFLWALKQDKKVFFMPDEHLGVNTARELGIKKDAIRIYDPKREGGGLSAEEIKKAKVVVWKGFCLVHVAFSLQDINEVRTKLPNAKIIVHPETPRSVASKADAMGSTSQIIQYVETAARMDEEMVVIGTECNLVERLADEYRGRIKIKVLAPSVCANMAKTNESNLLELLEQWPERNEVHVSKETAGDARKCLSTMLKL